MHFINQTYTIQCNFTFLIAIENPIKAEDSSGLGGTSLLLIRYAYTFRVSKKTLNDM